MPEVKHMGEAGGSKMRDARESNYRNAPSLGVVHTDCDVRIGKVAGGGVKLDHIAKAGGGDADRHVLGVRSLDGWGGEGGLKASEEAWNAHYMPLMTWVRSEFSWLALRS